MNTIEIGSKVEFIGKPNPKVSTGDIGIVNMLPNILTPNSVGVNWDSGEWCIVFVHELKLI